MNEKYLENIVENGESGENRSLFMPCGYQIIGTKMNSLVKNQKNTLTKLYTLFNDI